MKNPREPKHGFSHRTLILAMLILGVFLFSKSALKAQDDSSDAVAYRVLPNSSYVSPELWYEKVIKASGTPQSLTVDGYQAVRDGRTVYVDAANVDMYCLNDPPSSTNPGTKCQSDSECGASTCSYPWKFYTNIYLISYNKAAEDATVDIFGQILSHWKFNTNLNEKTGSCNISTIIAASQKDCPAGYDYDAALRRCLLHTVDKACSKDSDCDTAAGVYCHSFKCTYTCLHDSECPTGQFCSSLKAQVVRDTKRLADINDVKEAANDYYDKNGNYPLLKSGTYLPNKSISAWPSWQKTLSEELDIKLPVDPINRLGYCGVGNFDPITCWDEQNKIFADKIPNNFVMPDRSSVYVYKILPDGSTTTICAILESPFLSELNIGSCAASINVAGVAYTTPNRPPEIYCDGLKGTSGKPFSGSFRISDPDKDPIKWTRYDTAPSSQWLTWKFRRPPTITPGFPSSVKTINMFQAAAGADGTYKFTLTAQDSRGTTTVKECYINVGILPPVIAATFDSCTKSLRVGEVYPTCILSATDPTGRYSPLTFSFSGLPPGMQGDPTGAISGTPTKAGVYTVSFVAINSVGVKSARQSFQLSVNTYCGDGIKQQPNMEKLGGPANDGKEDCDGTDGITLNPLESTAYKQYVCTAPGPGVNGCAFVNKWCGNKQIDTDPVSEECDDGNEVDVDSCSNSCRMRCLSYSADQINFNDGVGDAVIYEDDSSTELTGTVGNYLKLSGVMPTPYIWLGNSTWCHKYRCTTCVDPTADPATCACSAWDYNICDKWCDPGVDCELVSKMRTFDGPKRECVRLTDGTSDCFWDTDPKSWEKKGQLIGTYPVSNTVVRGDHPNPSRTAVNTETGDMWIANRWTGDVSMLDINGNIIKTCLLGRSDGGPRGIAIEENGDAWIGVYGEYKIVKVSGNNIATDCIMDPGKDVIDLAPYDGTPYGLAIDSEQNIWVASQGHYDKTVPGNLDNEAILKIDTKTKAVTRYTVDSIYGIASDQFDNVWAGGYNIKGGAWKVNNATDALEWFDLDPQTPPAPPIWTGATGITSDLYGNIWTSALWQYKVYKLYQDGTVQFSRPTVPAPHGIAGDSKGNVWSVSMAVTNPDNVKVFNQDGKNLGIYPSNDTISVINYTYSDMTGLNRAMILRSGIWKKQFDGGFNGMYWGDLEWQNLVFDDTKQSVCVYARTADTKDELKTESWISATTSPNYCPASSTITKIPGGPGWNDMDQNDPDRHGRYLEIQVKMRTRIRENTPVVWGIRIDCD